MRILFDHCVPKSLRDHLPNHEIRTAYQMGWADLKNGRLLETAQADFDVLLTVDQSIEHQQNMRGFSIALVVLIAPNNKVETLAELVQGLEALLPSTLPGSTYRVDADTPSM